MSQQTLATLQQLKDEYEQNDVNEKDSIGHFVQRQALKLGLVSSKTLDLYGERFAKLSLNNSLHVKYME